MENIARRVISVNEDGNNIFIEKKLNFLNSNDKTDLRVIANSFENKFKDVELFDIEYKPTITNTGYFCPVVFEDDGGLYMLETDFTVATYEKCLERLSNSKSNGFIIKLIPTKYCIFSIDNSTTKTIIESNLTRTVAKQRAKELNLKSSLLEYDYEIFADLKSLNIH